VADLRTYWLQEDFDTIVCIGLLMFADCSTAVTQLEQLQSHVRRGGTAVINIRVDGTRYLDMFEPASCCLFRRDEMASRFAGCEIVVDELKDFTAPRGEDKSFCALVARRPSLPAIETEGPDRGGALDRAAAQSM